MPFVIDDLALAGAAAAADGAGASLPAWLAPMLASLGLSTGAQMAAPKYGMSQPGAVPQMENDQIDFSRLVGQQASTQLPKLQLQNRLPRPY